MLDREDRFAELMARAARPSEAPAEVPADLEARLLAFTAGAAAGAARVRRRHQPLLWGVPALCAAGVAGVLWLGPALSREEAVPAAAPAPPPMVAAVAPVPPAPSDVTCSPPVEPPAPAPAVASPAVESPALQASDWRSRKVGSLHAAQTFPGDAGTELLARVLTEDPDWRVRETALRALVQRPGRVAALALARATVDPHLGIRLPAVNALGQRLEIGAPVTDALLRRLDRDPDWRIRDAALTFLLRSAERERAATMALADHHRRLRERAREGLALQNPVPLNP